MNEIMPPRRPGDYADRCIDCDLALEPPFQMLAHQAEAAGWTEDEVAATLLSLAANHIKRIVADRKTLASMTTALRERLQ